MEHEHAYREYMASCKRHDELVKLCQEFYPGLTERQAVFRSRLDGLLNGEEFHLAASERY